MPAIGSAGSPRIFFVGAGLGRREVTKRIECSNPGLLS
jgi:hypothetical protein